MDKLCLGVVEQQNVGATRHHIQFDVLTVLFVMRGGFALEGSQVLLIGPFHSEMVLQGLLRVIDGQPVFDEIRGSSPSERVLLDEHVHRNDVSHAPVTGPVDFLTFVVDA